MLNFELTDLRLVSPRDGWPNDEATRNATGALDDGKVQVQVFENLSDAIADLQYCLATTARPRDMVKDVYTPQGAISKIHENHTKAGLVFGGERAGLSNDDIALCNSIITFPVNTDFSSLNLSQAVLLCAWEWMRSLNKAHDKVSFENNNDLANKDDVHRFLGRLENALETADFFKSKDLKPKMMRNIHSIFTRNDLTDQEVRTLQGILTALKGKS